MGYRLRHRFGVMAFAAAVLTGISSCSQRAWYEGVQIGHVQRCTSEVPRSERESCLAEHDAHYYDYQRQRGEIRGEQPQPMR